MSCCPLPKKAAQHTALFACDGVHQCVILWWVVSVCEHVVGWWCGGCREKKREKRKHTVKQKTKRTSPKTTFSLSPFFPPLFLPLLFTLPSTLPPSLPSYPYTHLFFILQNGCIRGEPKTPMTQHLIHFNVSSFCPNSLFSSFPSADDSMMIQSQSNTTKPSNNIHLTLALYKTSRRMA